MGFKSSSPNPQGVKLFTDMSSWGGVGLQVSTAIGTPLSNARPLL